MRQAAAEVMVMVEEEAEVAAGVEDKKEDKEGPNVGEVGEARPQHTFPSQIRANQANHYRKLAYQL